MDTQTRNMYFQTAKSGVEFKNFLLTHSAISEASIRSYNTVIQQLLKGFESEPSIDDLNLWLRSHPLSKNRGALLYYFRWKGWSEKKLINIKQRQPKPREMPLFEKVFEILDLLEVEERHIALFMLYTGCRCSEALKVKLKDLSKEGKVVLRTKGDKFRVMQIHTEYNYTLQHYLRETKGLADMEYIFYSDKTATINSKRDSFYRHLNVPAKKILGRPVGTHDFRRLMAMFLYRKTKDIRLVQRILGHSDVSTTMRYVQHEVIEEDIKLASGTIHKQLGHLRKH